ncbi:protein artichoke [Phlebotomus argentipes]|uniref:protein artichoke n=1 Tax=Phlebotomus argentipes TaxID=94469 RepID=UPI002892DCD0|nr:protein artichoke [Phlebotomus argentipes]
MATLLYTIFGITAGASLHCAVRREISPCTCAPHETFPNSIVVTCERMETFSQVVDALQDRFQMDAVISLTITHSQLEDLEARAFWEMNMNVKNLRLNFDNLTHLPESMFYNMSRTEFLSISDNNLEVVPAHIFKHMPTLGTLDIARCRLQHIRSEDFRSLKKLRHLVLASNQIKRIDTGAFPPNIVTLHIGRNNLATLNGTLRHLNELKLLFINSNNLTTLEDELPPTSPSLILAQFNRIRALPQSFRNLPLDALYMHDNELSSFDGILKTAKNLQKFIAHNNYIEYLAEDEFQEAESLEDLQLSCNHIRAINGSLLPIRKLRSANFTVNYLTEFSLKEIRGLDDLRILDLSFNKIEKLAGRMDNLVEPDSLIVELHLEYNLLRSLDGNLMGLNRLRILNLSNNRLQSISPDDLIGLEELEHLDVSFNRLKTLEETSKTYLPSLQFLNASFNLLTEMKNDFHGLPILCMADLSNNNISIISKDLVANTRCSNHGVPNKLEILLQENPVLCNESLTDLVTAMEEQHARILGVAHCIVPQEIALDNPIMLPPLPLLPKIVQKPVSIVPNSIMQSPPSIVQVIVPSPVVIPVAQPLISGTTTLAPTTTAAATTTPRPQEDTTTEAQQLLSTASEVAAEVVRITEESPTTTERSPPVTAEASSTPAPQVIVQGLHEMTHQVAPEPEEPPETLQDEGAPPERLPSD